MVGRGELRSIFYFLDVWANKKKKLLTGTVNSQSRYYLPEQALMIIQMSNIPIHTPPVMIVIKI